MELFQPNHGAGFGANGTNWSWITWCWKLERFFYYYFLKGQNSEVMGIKNPALKPRVLTRIIPWWWDCVRWLPGTGGFKDLSKSMDNNCVLD